MRRLPALLAALALTAPVILTGCGGGGGSDARTELLDQLRADGKAAGVPEAIVECMVNGADELSDEQISALIGDAQDAETEAAANAILESCMSELPAG